MPFRRHGIEQARLGQPTAEVGAHLDRTGRRAQVGEERGQAVQAVERRLARRRELLKARGRLVRHRAKLVYELRLTLPPFSHLRILAAVTRAGKRATATWDRM